MTEPLIIEGLTYISIRDAAVSSRLSTEYLGRLARQHRLRARTVGRMWFIETHSLQQFLSTPRLRPIQGNGSEDLYQ
jgi:hypothetical protein